MDLTQEDRQRIEQVASKRYYAGESKESFIEGVEVATIYERQQQAELRNKVIQEVIERLRGIVSMGYLEMSWTIIEETLNSLKTK